MTIKEKLIILLDIEETDIKSVSILDIIIDSRCVFLENLTNLTDVLNNKKCEHILITLICGDFNKGIENYTIKNMTEGEVKNEFDDIPLSILKQINKLKVLNLGDL